MTYQGNEFQMQFNKRGCDARMYGYIMDQGVKGTREVRDFETLDTIAPFVGSVLDMCCGLTNFGSVTTSAVMSADLFDYIFLRGQRTGWSKKRARSS